VDITGGMCVNGQRRGQGCVIRPQFLVTNLTPSLHCIGVISLKIPGVVDGGLDLFGVGHDDGVHRVADEGSWAASAWVLVVVHAIDESREVLLRHLVQVADTDASSKDAEVRVLGSMVCSCEKQSMEAFNASMNLCTAQVWMQYMYACRTMETCRALAVLFRAWSCGA